MSKTEGTERRSDRERARGPVTDEAGGESRSRRFLRATRWPVGALACLALYLFPLAAAQAVVPGDPQNPFNPSLWVKSTDSRAGISPDLTITLSKPPNYCKEVEREDIPGLTECFYKDAYEEQDFKKLTLDLPPGLVPDPNAASKCDPIFMTDFLRKYPGEKPKGVWWCPNAAGKLVDEAARVGTVEGRISNCYYGLEEGEPTHPFPCYPDFLSYGYYGYPDFTYIKGDIYMAEPRPGEQGHLIILVGADMTPLTPEVDVPNADRVDMSVHVDRAGKVEAVVDGIPDGVEDYDDEGEPAGKLAMQPYALHTTLWGEKGAAAGHPLLTNATSCGPKQWSGTAQGYAYNVSYDGNDPWGMNFGFGDGKTAPVSAPYTVQGCNEVPYEPSFDLKLTPSTPGSAPAITSTLSQKDGEQTTGEVTVTFPKGFGLNFENNRAQCTEAEFAALKCPRDSVIGEATATSRLLPVDQGPVKGDVYLGPTDFAQGVVNLFVNVKNDFLPDGIDIRGQATMQADGRIVTTFKDLPELPMQNFEMTLFGGDDTSLMRVPKTCGTYEISTTFQSHNGKQVKRVTPVFVPCGAANLDVTLGTRRPKAHPTLNLDVTSAGIKSLTLDVSRYLHVAKPRRLEAGKRYGYLTFNTPGGVEELKAKLMRSDSFGSLNLSATRGGSQVTSLGAYNQVLEGKSKKKLSKRSKHRRGSAGRRLKRGPTRFWINDIPSGTTTVSLELDGSRDGLLQNPSRCRTTKGKRIFLGFTARVVDTEGRRHTLHRRMRMRCGKSKRAKKRR